jgi:hypothetical protein
LSSILKALKKIEGRKVDTSIPAWPYGGGNLGSTDRHIHRSRQRQKLLGLLIILCVAALAGKLYIGSRPESEVKKSPEKTVIQSPQSPSKTLSEKPAETPPATRKIVEKAPESTPATEPPPREAPPETASRSTIPAPPAKETAAETPAPSVASAPESEETTAAPPAPPSAEKTTVQAPAPETTSPPAEKPSEAAAEPTQEPAATEIFSSPPSDNAGLSLMALVWAEQPESRFVVINGIIVRQEGTIDNSIVVRIEEDYVVMKTDGLTWKLK